MNEVKLLTPDTFHDPIFWLNAVADWNMETISPTEDTFHPFIDELPPLLKDDACLNIRVIEVTPDTFHEPIF